MNMDIVISLLKDLVFPILFSFASAIGLIEFASRLLKGESFFFCNNCDMIVKRKSAMNQDEILKIVWEVLHEGYSIDLPEGQDYVYQIIVDRVNGKKD